MWNCPSTAALTQKSSRLCTTTSIATEKMRSFVFPQEIVQEMIRRDQVEHREITPSVYGLNGSTIEEGAIEGVTVTGVCMAIINMNPSFPTTEAEFPPRAQ